MDSGWPGKPFAGRHCNRIPGEKDAAGISRGNPAETCFLKLKRCACARYVIIALLSLCLYDAVESEKFNRR